MLRLFLIFVETFWTPCTIIHILLSISKESTSNLATFTLEVQRSIKTENQP